MGTKIFLSHSSKNKTQVRKLASDLRAAGVNVWLDEWEIQVGDPITQKIQKGIQDSDYVAVWLTEDSVRSGWVEREWQSRFHEEIHTKEPVVLPLLGQDCEIPSLLADKKYADFTKDYQSALKELLIVLLPHGPVSIEVRASLLLLESANYFENIEAIRKILTCLRHGDTSAEMALRTAVSHSNPEVREIALEGLEFLSKCEAICILTTALDDSIPAVRGKAVTLLTEARPANLIDLVIPLLDDDDKKVWDPTLSALINSGSPAAEPIAIRLSSNDFKKNVERRSAAYKTLGKIGGEIAIHCFRLGLLCDDQMERHEAAIGVLELYQYRFEKAAKDLVSGKSDIQQTLIPFWRWVSEAYKGMDLAVSVYSYVNSNEVYLKYAFTSSIEIMLPYLSSANAPVRGTIIMVITNLLPTFGTTATTEVLNAVEHAALHDPDEDIRAQAANAASVLRGLSGKPLRD
jgi:HEAT repeat protein